MHLLTLFPGAGKWFEFLKREDGVVTVEALLWLPVYFGAFMLMTDVAMNHDGQTLLYGAVQDASSIAPADVISMPTGTQTDASASAQALVPQTIPDTTKSDGSAVTTVPVPANELITAVWFGGLAGSDATVSGAHVIEF